MAAILRPPYPRVTTFRAVDPGVKYYACAWFAEGRLWRAELNAIEAPPDEGGTLVIEMPQVYRTGKSRLSDITDLAFAAGVVAGRAASVVRYLPSEWKGQTPKATHQARIVQALDEQERLVLAGRPKKDLHHIVDAVGLGLYHLGRIGR